MENFFNYISKPIPPEELEIWFKVNNVIPEKMELFSDLCQSLTLLIIETYLGEQKVRSETKIQLSSEDDSKHFEWCLNKVIDNFQKEGIFFNKKGEHTDYFINFYNDVFYNQKEEKVRKSIKLFFKQLFDINTPFSKSDLDIVLLIYKNLNKNMIN
jgi:hypothetical protein